MRRWPRTPPDLPGLPGAAAVRAAFAGDPELDCGPSPSATTLERIAYATAVLRRAHPRFAGDLHRLRASTDLFEQVAFRELRRCRRTAAHPAGLQWCTVAVVTLPAGPRGRPTVDLRSGGRAPPRRRPPPSPPPDDVAGARGTAP